MKTIVIGTCLLTLLIASRAESQQPGGTGSSSSSIFRPDTDLSKTPYSTLRERRDVLGRNFESLQRAVEEAEKNVWRWENLAGELGAAETDLIAAKEAKDTGRQRFYEGRVAELKRSLAEKDAQVGRARSDLDIAKEKLAAASSERDAIDSEMTKRIDLETPQQDFKKIMSITFAGLVGMVIIGFFLIASWDQEVRRDVFSDQAGLQFITLFSLVIAIILFGIVEILEGKELAALLGGLSGYILGRTNAQQTSDTTQPAAE